MESSYPACNGNAIYTEEDASFTETVKYQENVVFGAASGYCLFRPSGQLRANQCGLLYKQHLLQHQFPLLCHDLPWRSMTVENTSSMSGR